MGHRPDPFCPGESSMAPGTLAKFPWIHPAAHNMTDFSSLLFAQSDKITSWFTTTWMISVGVSAGFVLVLLWLLKIWVFSRIAGLNRIGETAGGFWTAGILTGSVLGGLVCWGILAMRGWERISGGLTEKLGDFYGDAFLTWVFPAAVCLFLGFGFWAAVSRGRAPEVLGAFHEGFLRWINWLVIGLVCLAAAGYGLAMVDGFGILKFVNDPNAILQSMLRLHRAGAVEIPFAELAPSGADSKGHELDVDFRGEELQYVEVRSNQQIELSATAFSASLSPRSMFRVPSTSLESPARFSRGEVIPEGQVTRLYLANRGRNPASGSLLLLTRPIYPEASILPAAAVATFLLYLVVLSGVALFPKVSAISLSTFKTEVNQPLFYLVMLAGLSFVAISIFLPYNTFGEDIKMYKDSGLTLIRVLAIFVAIWAASKSVAEEIEGRTALTVLSKPVGRRQFVLGKISGIVLVIAFLFISLGLWFVFWTAFKPLYDAVESSRTAAEWGECFAESTSVIPALFLAFLEACLFVVISVMISTRLGILPNLVICFSIYVLGHITPLLVMSSTVVNAFEPVVFFGKLIAIVFPVLDNFSVEAAIMTNSAVPIPYLLLSLLYSILYGAIGVLLSLVLFEDRDLA